MKTYRIKLKLFLYISFLTNLKGKVIMHLFSNLYFLLNIIKNIYNSKN